MKEPLVIVGAGGFAQEVAWIALQQPERWDVRGFLDDDAERAGTKVLGLPILGATATYKAHDDAKFVIARGAPRTRLAVRRAMRALEDDRFATLIDPSAKRHESVRFGPGSIVCAGVVATVDINVGAHAIVNLNATVGHECPASLTASR